MSPTADLLPGTLDMLILKAVSLRPLHGYGVLLRIQQISRQALQITQGSLYPALYRLEHQGLIARSDLRCRETTDNLNGTVRRQTADFSGAALADEHHSGPRLDGECHGIVEFTRDGFDFGRRRFIGPGRLAGQQWRQ